VLSELDKMTIEGIRSKGYAGLAELGQGGRKEGSWATVWAAAVEEKGREGLG
jgi:hypothetical protein